MFAVQSEIAQKVAKRLHTKVTPAERLSIDRRAQCRSYCFDLYARAKNLFKGEITIAQEQGRLTQAVDQLNQAVTRDPSFFLAYCQPPSLMTSFISLAMTILPRGWPRRGRPFKRHFVSGRMPAKRVGAGV